MDSIEIKLLGGFKIQIYGVEIPLERIRLRKGRSLVKLLALAPGHRLHREQLMELLWPYTTPELAANNLNQALFAARHGLSLEGTSSARTLVYEGENLYLASSASLWVDVDAFENAAVFARRSRNPTDYYTALDLYTGDLLPEDLYEDWTDSRRIALRMIHLGLLLELGRVHGARHEYPLGIDVLKKLVQVEPANEEAHVELMRFYALGGQRRSALRQYKALVDVLSSELGIEPEPGSTQLFNDIQSGKYPPPDQGLPSTAQTAPRHNLPEPLSSFIGREDEIEQVVEAMTISRLVTLIGSGGVGKTRLSLQAAERVLDAFPDGVWFVELAPVSNPEIVTQVVARTLGIQEEPGREWLDTLTYFLRGSQALLVLDNCEHLMDASARLVDALLKSAPRLKIIVTSREALGIAGESAYRVRSLRTPDPRSKLTPAELREYEAVKLFTERARAVLPTYKVDEKNADAVAEICWRLDGIPLALELASARLSMLTTEQLASRLDDAFRVLSGGSRTTLPRHQTLRAAIDWSYQLLSEGEKRLFRRLAVFSGGGDLAAIEAVCAGDGLETGDILDLLRGLVNKSMVNFKRIQHTETRFWLLETVKQYAREKLNDSGESARLDDRHLEYYLGLAEKIETPFHIMVGVDKLEVLEREIDNLRSGLSWALDVKDSQKVEAGLRLASALWALWYEELQHEGCSWLEKGLSAISQDDPELLELRAKASHAAGLCYKALGYHEKSQQMWSESLETYRKIGDAVGVINAQSELAFNFAMYRNPEGRELCESNLAFARTIDDPLLLASAIAYCAGCANMFRDYYQARKLIEESLSIYEKVGNMVQVGRLTAYLGANSSFMGDYSTAAISFKKALKIGQASGSTTFIIDCLDGLGEVACMQDDFEQMEVYFSQSVEIARVRKLHLHNIYGLRGVGTALKRQNRFLESTDYFMESLPLAQEVEDVYGVYAAMAGIAGVAVWKGCQLIRAVRLLGAVAALFATYYKPLDKFEQREFDRDVAAAKTGLGEEDFSQAWSEGQALPLEQAIREAILLGHEIQENS